MKTKHLGRYFFSIAITAFLVFLTGSAAEALATRQCDLGTNPAKCVSANDYIVAAPYWQVDAGSYTFIAVSHSSLSGMASQIGVKVNAINSSGGAYATAESFTVSAGATQRLFIVPTNHANINPTAISTAKFLSGTSDYSYGHIRVEPITTHPMLQRGGAIPEAHWHGQGFRDATMLSYWGSVIIEANTTGFAMEFIGDMNDSTTPSFLKTAEYGSSGVNLP